MKSLLPVLLSIFLTITLAFGRVHRTRRKPSSTVESHTQGLRLNESHTQGLRLNESQALRRIIEIENSRKEKDPFLKLALNHTSYKVRKRAVLALGRIQDTSAMDEMAQIMNQKSDSLKDITAFSLSLMGNELALKLLTQVLALNKKPEVLAPVLTAIGRIGGQNTIMPLSDFIKPNVSPILQEAACQGLGLSWSKDSRLWSVPTGLTSRLLSLAIGKNQAALAASFALSRYKGDPSLLKLEDLIKAVSQTELVFAKVFLIRTLAKIKSPIASQALALELTSSTYPEIKIEAARGLLQQPATQLSMSSLVRALGESNTAVVRASLETLSEASITPLMQEAISRAILNLHEHSKSNWIKQGALITLAKIDPDVAKPQIEKILATPRSQEIESAIYASTLLSTKNEFEKVTGYLASQDPKYSEAAIEALTSIDENLIFPQVKSALKKTLERGDAGLTTMISEMVEKYRWKDFLPSLISVYPLLKNTTEIDAKRAVLNALEVVGDYSSTQLLQLAVKDTDREVSLAAARALKAIIGIDRTGEVPLNSKIESSVPSNEIIQAALNSRATILTTRGKIELHFLDQAPLTVTNFVKLANRGFYDGLSFHRVIPNFVAQGGDPRGDGFGGPGYYIRDELSQLRHSRGTLGMATSGKDTAGSQFFINLAPNFHLDGRYTVFAEITQGMEVADLLEVGDKIISIRLR